MTTGLILLLIAGVLVLLGVGQRVLDKLRLNDRQALLWIALILAGTDGQRSQYPSSTEMMR